MTLTGERRPQLPGRVVGLDPTDSYEHCVDVTWLVDTGAELATVRDCVGRQFGYQRVEGLYTTSTTGGPAGLVVDGLQAEFSVEDQAGMLRTVRSSRYIAAHNGHVQRWPGTVPVVPAWTPMGMHLADRLGDGYS